MGALAHVSDAVLLLDPHGRVRGSNEAAEALFRRSASELRGMEAASLLPYGAPLLGLLAAPDRSTPLELEVELALGDGTRSSAALTAVRSEGRGTVLICRPLNLLEPTATREPAPGPQAATAGAGMRGGSLTASILQRSRDIFFLFGEEGEVRYASQSGARYGADFRGGTLESLLRLMHPRDARAARAALARLERTRLKQPPSARSPRTGASDAEDREGSANELSLNGRFRIGESWRWFELSATYLEEEGTRGLLVQAREADEQIQSAVKLRADEAYFRALFEKSREGVVLIGANRRILRTGGAAAALLGIPESELIGGKGLTRLHPNDEHALLEVLDLIEAREGASESVRFRFRSDSGEYDWLEGTLTNLLHDPSVKAFLLNFRERREAAEALAKIRNLNEELRRRVSHLQSLRRIDMAINNSVDLRLVLDIFLMQVMQDLGVDAVAVLLYEAGVQALRPIMGRGLGGELRQRSTVRLGDGPAGRAAIEQRSVFVPNLESEGSWGAAASPEQQAAFSSYMAVPMVAKGQLQGVIELYSRSPIEPNDEWLEFLETYADQGAIAIENSQLIRSLERSHQELQRAYDLTIEGWANALDLRDEETAGHSKRVTEMTVRLARHLGVAEQEIVHIQRGALLHDIGKMGIPDEILRKPAPLSDAEFEVMRQHPLYSYELLSPIEFLRPALQIPLSHHEKWDGTGYPHGLKGEGIPLAARIFAVVDVFDALTSDRPYRPAWSAAEARAYVLGARGSHFDPAVVDAFFELLEEGAPDNFGQPGELRPEP